jgi:hypothetical protein
MTQSSSNKIKRRGRIFPEIQWSPEKLAQYKVEREEFFQRCQTIFKRVRPELIEKYYGWYMAIEPNSGNYFIDADKDMARKKAREKYPNAITCMFCINETGACGRI